MFFLLTAFFYFHNLIYILILKNYIFLDIKEICMKEAWSSSLEYLRELREDIEKIKDNIDQKIEGLEQVEGEQRSSQRLTAKEDIMPNTNPAPNASRSTATSAEREHNASQNTKVRSHYKNNSSKNSQILETKGSRQKSVNNSPERGYFAATNPKSLNKLTNLPSRDEKVKNQETPVKRSRDTHKLSENKNTKSAYMSDKKAANYVNQLIKNFKESYNFHGFPNN